MPDRFMYSATFKLNNKKQIKKQIELHFQQLFDWPLDGTAANGSTSFATKTSCLQCQTAVRPFD